MDWTIICPLSSRIHALVSALASGITIPNDSHQKCMMELRNSPRVVVARLGFTCRRIRRIVICECVCDDVSTRDTFPFSRRVPPLLLLPTSNSARRQVLRGTARRIGGVEFSKKTGTHIHTDVDICKYNNTYTFSAFYVLHAHRSGASHHRDVAGPRHSGKPSRH